MEVNKAYKLEKIKKTGIKSENGKLRLATTNFSKISHATPNETNLFADVKIADKKLQGTCMMFNNLHLYKSCNKHLTKLDDDGTCGQCGLSSENIESADFRCSLIIQSASDETLTEITIFKRHLSLKIDKNCNEDDLIDMLENSIVGKGCEIHYNETGTENNIAVKITITQ